MNRWTDSSLELGLPGLTLEGTASRLNAPAAWPDGDWGLTLTGQPGALGNPATYGLARRTVTTMPGVSYSLSAMVSLFPGSPVAPLIVEARTVGGTVLATYSLATGGAPFAPWAPGSFAATEAQTIVEWRCDRPATGGATWALDLLTVDEPEGDDMSLKLDIVDAAIAQMKTIAPPTYTTTVQDVLFGYQDPSTAGNGIKLALFPMPERVDWEAITRPSKRFVLGIQILCRGTDAERMVLEAEADVENCAWASFQATGQFFGIGEIDEVIRGDSEPDIVAEQLYRDGVRSWLTALVIDYTHERGEA